MKTYAVSFALFIGSINAVLVSLPNYGQLRGVFDHSRGLTKFLGVPYAQPPVGGGRFARSVDPNPWTAEVDATNQKPACPQDLDFLKHYSKETKNQDGEIVRREFDEDCLYVNIFVPGQVDQIKSLPILVHIHDGMFQVGSSGGVDGSKLAVNDNIIVVTFNYRLGVLGFYGKENYGLHDQNMALRWVKANIKHFGGSPDQITVSGSGSGAFSVGLHVLSNESNALFQRAVSLGGSPFQNDYIISPSKSKSMARSFSAAVGCSCCYFDCLRKADLSKILEAQQALSATGVFFTVTDGGIFTPSSMEHVSGENSTSTVTDYVIGVNTGAGAEFVQPNLRNQDDLSTEQFQNAVNNFTMETYPLISRAVTEMALLEYGQQTSLLAFRRDAVVASVRDAQMRLTKAGINMYSYLSTTQCKLSHNSLISSSTKCDNRALFDNAIDGQFYDLLKNFIKTGTPTVGDGKDVFQWPKFNVSQQQIFITSDKADDISSKYPDDIEEHVLFWSDLVPNMAKTCEMCSEGEVKGEKEGPVLELKQGKVRGDNFTLDSGYTFELYRDIPYAKAPLGELRFGPPRPHGGWDGILEPQEQPISCMQATYMMVMVPETYTEDCLHLDVYVPQSAEKTRMKKLPVMVFIHGGGFSMGSKNTYNGAALTMYDVIVVTINYRLGVLGFLSTEDDFLPGNYGLMDQAFAIKWVKLNAERFGGDPQRITVFGESAGGGSVALQMLMPSNKGLFQRGIAQSGGSFIGSFFGESGYKGTALKLAEAFNCSTYNGYAIRECLRNVEPDYLSTLGPIPDEEKMSLMGLFPRVDGVLFPKSIEELYDDGVTRDFQFMTGTTKDEGYLFVGMMQGALFMLPEYEDNSTLLGQAMHHFYRDLFEARDRGAGISDTAYMKMATDFETDLIITSHSEKDANSNSRNGGQTYRYLLRFHSSHPGWPGMTTPDWTEGLHGDDLYYMFGHPLVNVSNNRWFLEANFTWPERDVELSKRMLMAWTNFAHTGDPNKGPSSFDYEWPLYTEENPNIFEFNDRLAETKGLGAVLNKNEHPEIFRPKALKYLSEVVPAIVKEDRKLKACRGKSSTTAEGHETSEQVSPTDETSTKEESNPSSTHEEL